MSRGMDSRAVPFAPILQMMSLDASRQVAEGVVQLNEVIHGSVRRRIRLSTYLRSAVEQLYRTYFTLACEVRRVCTLDSGELAGAIAGLRRRELVARVHRTKGDFSVIERLCHALQPHGDNDPGLASAAAILGRWTDREVHLFGLLVPLATYTEELARELEALVLSSRDLDRVDARLAAARSAMNPVLRHLCNAAGVLNHFHEDLKRISVGEPELIS
jgi:hypothetical protein